MNCSRGALTAQIPRKRKERDDFFLQSFKSKNDHCVRGKLVQPHSSQPNTTSSKPKPGEVCSIRLLAGYMAHEFLTNGTLLGEKFDLARAQAVPLATVGADPKKKPTPQPPTKSNSGTTAEAGAGELKMKSYAELASLLKTDGAHIPGIVNPSQLARWIQM